MLVVVLIPTKIAWALTQDLKVSSKSACLMDMKTGRVLYAKNKDEPRLVASIAKIMTAILAIESGRLDEEVIVGEEVLTMYGSNIYIELREKIKLIDLVYGLMLRSGNDSAIVIATFVAGSEEKFVKMMNAKAVSIGMKNTVFNNSHGLDEVTENRTTAYDMALLSRYASKNKTYMEISGTKKYSASSDRKSYLWHNRNKLLSSYKYATGGKTGFTPRAGRTLVTTASNKKLDLTVVTLSDGNEYQTHQTLYEYGFNNFKEYLVLDKRRFKIDDNFYQDKIVIKENFSYLLSESEKENLKVEVKLTKLNRYRNGDVVGVVRVLLNSEQIHSQRVYVNTEGKRGFFSLVRSWFN